MIFDNSKMDRNYYLEALRKAETTPEMRLLCDIIDLLKEMELGSQSVLMRDLLELKIEAYRRWIQNC